VPAILSLLILAVAVSLDSFGVGAMYGLRKIRIPLLSILIIAGCSGLVILLAMNIGSWLSAFLSPSTARIIGALILVGIGIWTVFQMLLQKDEPTPPLVSPPPSTDNDAGKPAVWSIELKRIGIVIQILRTPSIADADRSGTISSNEAAMLGLALSLDAFGAGIGAALVGFSPLHTAVLIAGASALFLSIGLKVGFRFADLNGLKRFSVLPGIILILMGLAKLL